MIRRKSVQFVACFVCIAGVIATLCGGSIQLKSLLAQYLLRTSWERTISEGREVKPWPWADTHPVARLSHDALGVDLIVLKGDQGAVLAFGPGHMEQSSLPPKAGNCIIAGHQDTSFSFLKDVRHGDLLHLQAVNGKSYLYTVTSKKIVHRNSLYFHDTMDPWLTLTTCYPVDGVAYNSELRLVISARVLDKKGGGLRESS